jgi:hypothetical protein
VDRLRPIPDRAVRIGPHRLDQRLVVSHPLGEPSVAAAVARLVAGLVSERPSCALPKLGRLITADHTGSKKQNVGVMISDQKGSRQGGRSIELKDGGERFREQRNRHKDGNYAGSSISGRPTRALRKFAQTPEK